MNNNIENYKKAVDKIHPSEELINKTITRAKNNTNKKQHNKLGNIFMYSIAGLSACAAMLFLVLNVVHFDKNPGEDLAVVNTDEMDINQYIKKFNSQEELDNKLEELKTQRTDDGYYDDLDDVISSSSIFEDFAGLAKNGSGAPTPGEFDSFSDSSGSASSKSFSNSTASNSTGYGTSPNYSTTNVQVEGVDEADIIKTDGEKIYFVKNNTITVVDKNLKLVDKKDVEKVTFKELYITSKSIVLVGSRYNSTSYQTYTSVLVLDKNTLEEKRKGALLGNYIDSRLIGDNIYLVSKSNIDRYSNSGIKIPEYEDSTAGNTTKQFEYNDIYYIDDFYAENFINICSFNIEDKKAVNVESFMGMNPTIYCSLDNMYFVNSTSKYSKDNKIEILKVKLANNELKLDSRAVLPGTINDQFSIDEYNGYLRVATTEYVYDTWLWEEDYEEERILNHLYVLDDKMKIVGQTDDYGVNEKIYSVRFIKDVAYVVTFKEIDPLFVMDLSDPKNPTIRGELKIPGYSSYLHPYDDTHIIGIGYNTKSNGYGGYVNDNLKMSMFDVSDLDNPKELYSINIGESKSVSSQITSNHKALLYDKERSLIGFPLTDGGKSGFVIYKINKDNFENIVSHFDTDKNYYSGIQRIIYIEDIVYALSSNDLKSYDLYTMDLKEKYQIVQSSNNRKYIYDDYDY